MDQALIVNGTPHDFGAVELDIDGKFILLHATGIDYKDALEGENVYGASPQRIGRTRGQYTAEGSLKATKRGANTLTSALAPIGGLYDVVFGLRVIYKPSDFGAPMVDILRGVKITSRNQSHSSGASGLEVDFTLDISLILENGKPPLSVFVL